MSRYPWRNTSEDIAAEAQSQWETPGGAQEKADAAEQAAKNYSDEKLNDHIGTGGTAHATVIAGGAAGFMTGLDKTKLDGVAPGANNYVHPATHPPSIIAQDVNNRFVTDTEKSTWNGKAETTEATTTSKGLMSPADKLKIDGIEAGAEVNQNAFARLNDVSATSKSDTLQITGGTGITVSTDPASKRVTVTATGEATPGPHASSHITGGSDVIPDAVTGGSSGLMSGADAQFVRVDGETKEGAQAKADAALAEAKEYVNTEIPDASLTKKGKVQLSSKTNGTSETLAATEKAVNDARVSVLEKTVSKESGYAPDANSVDPGFHFLSSDSANSPDGDWATLLDVGGAIKGRDIQIAQTWNVERLPYAIRRELGEAWSPWERLLTQPFNNAWANLPLLNNWVPYDTSTYRVGVMRYADGLNVIMGTVKNGIGSGILANIGGVALLPKKTVIGNYYSRSNDNITYASGMLELNANGDIRFGIGQSPQNGALQFVIVYNEREAV